MRFTDLFSSVKSTDTTQVRKLMDEKHFGSYTLLDVREPHEYEQGHIPGSVLIPLSKLPERIHVLDPEKEIITY